MKIIEDTAEFNQAFGKVRAAEGEALPKAVADQHIAHLHEEYRELLRALADEDRAAILDALVDLAYVAGGYAWATRQDRGLYLVNARAEFTHWGDVGHMGCAIEQIAIGYQWAAEDLIFYCYEVALTLKLPFEAAWDAVHAANMAKRLPDGTILRNEAGKVLKPPGWVAPDIAGILKKHDEGNIVQGVGA